MKKNTLSLALASALLAMTAAQASEFNGAYVGAQVGSDRSSASASPAANSTALGLSGGYNWDVSRVVLGVDGFYSKDSATTHTVAKTNYGSNVYGLDVKLGLPFGKWLPFVKVGADHTGMTADASAASGNGLHSALGAEYKFAPQWSAQAQYELAKANVTANGVASKTANKTTSIGVNYYFDKPAVAAAVAVVAAPVVMKAAEPVAAPAPVVAAPVAAPAPVVAAPAPVAAPKVFTLKGTNFATSSAKLMPSASAQLAEVLDFAAHNKENLSVVGHTDSRGKEAANQKLSASRAESVKAYLVQHGVDAKRISTAGKASTQPVGDNKTDAGRAANRRVEVTAVN